MGAEGRAQWVPPLAIRQGGADSSSRRYAVAPLRRVRCMPAELGSGGVAPFWGVKVSGRGGERAPRRRSYFLWLPKWARPLGQSLDLGAATMQSITVGSRHHAVLRT